MWLISESSWGIRINEAVIARHRSEETDFAMDRAAILPVGRNSKEQRSLVVHTHRRPAGAQLPPGTDCSDVGNGDVLDLVGVPRKERHKRNMILRHSKIRSRVSRIWYRAARFQVNKPQLSSEFRPPSVVFLAGKSNASSATQRPSRSLGFMRSCVPHRRERSVLSERV